VRILANRGERRQVADRSRGERSRGQALVEFALIAPIMVLIFAALVQFALIYERQIGIENAVRDGARRGATYMTPDPATAATNGPFVWNLVFGTGELMETNVQGYSGTAPPLLLARVCYRTQTDPAGIDGVMVKVETTYAHPLFLPLISQLLDPLDGSVDGALRISTWSEFQVHNDPSSDTSADVCYT